MAEEHDCSYTRGLDKGHLCAECSGKVVLWMSYYFDGDGDEECWKERQRVGQSPHFWV